MCVCSDAATGYILSFSIYTGKEPNVTPNGLAYDVVMRSATILGAEVISELFFFNRVIILH